jgi:hypothetical protein
MVTPVDSVLLGRIDSASRARAAVLTARQRLSAARIGSSMAASQHQTASRRHQASLSRLRELECGRGALLASVSAATVYEFWIQLPGYSGPVRGAAARLTQHGNIEHVSNVHGTTKGGLGGAAVGAVVAGPAGAVVGAVARRKTTVKTEIQVVDNRRFELEVSGPGFAWSTIGGPESEVAYRNFRDVVNARSSNQDDVHQMTAAQRRIVADAAAASGSAEAANQAASQSYAAEHLAYEQLWKDYAAIRLPILLDLSSRWRQISLVQRLVYSALAIPPLLVLLYLAATSQRGDATRGAVALVALGYLVAVTVLVGRYFVSVRLVKQPARFYALAAIGLAASSMVTLTILQQPDAPKSVEVPTGPQPPKAAQVSLSPPAGRTTSSPVTATRVPPPKFTVFKQSTDEGTSVVVPVTATDAQLESLLWLFRERIRGHRYAEVGLTQPTAKRWGKLGYLGGAISFYRGKKCAGEGFTDAVSPCGYGEHDDAFYQWGIDGDPNKDAAEIKKGGTSVRIFDYKDGWQFAREKTLGEAH